MKKAPGLCLLVFLTIGLRAQQPVSEHYQTAQFDVAIFPKEFKADLGKHIKRFTPTKQEVDTVEYFLHKKDVRNKKMNNSIYHNKNWHGYDWYKRQYFGCIDKKGNKYLYVVCLVELSGDYDHQKGYWLIKPEGIIWDSDEVEIFKFNLKTNELFDFESGGTSP